MKPETDKNESTMVHNPRRICIFIHMHGLSVCMVFKRAVPKFLRSCASSWNRWKIKQRVFVLKIEQMVQDNPRSFLTENVTTHANLP